MAKITQLVTGVAQRLQGASLAWLLSASIAIVSVSFRCMGFYLLEQLEWTLNVLNKA